MKTRKSETKAATKQPQVENAPSDGTLRFTVDAGLLFQLGEELVTNRSVALAELIKNAYDADASSVIVTFHDVRAAGGTIVVKDDGGGMSFERIRDSWMRIATTRKVKEAYSTRYKRIRTGAKGIGRFAARRLAKKLTLRSVAAVTFADGKPAREETTVEFDWNAFEAGSEVNTVPVRYSRKILPIGDAETCTELRLVNLRDAWSEADFQSFVNNLSRLVAPREADIDSSAPSKVADPGLDIQLESSEYPEYSGDVREQTLSGALATLEGTLTSDGQATYSVRFRTPEKTRTFSPKTKFAEVGEASFRIHFFVYRKDYFAGLEVSVRDAARKGRDEGGVHLYMDKFRVAPFGDPGNDWLKLDEDRGRRTATPPDDLAKLAGTAARPMLLLPGNNQLFGRVLLSRTKNKNIRQTLNREGVIEGPAFTALTSFVRKGIDYLTVAYARESEVRRKKNRETRTSPSTPTELLERARKVFLSASGAMPMEKRAQILQAIDLARETVATQSEDLISELSMLRVLASTGTMVVVFEHQLLGTLNGLRNSHRSLVEIVPRLPRSERKKFQGELDRLDAWIASAQDQGQLLGLLIARKARSRRRRLVIRPLVDSLLRALGGYAGDYGITLRNEVPATLRTPPMFEAELAAILLNLLTNALKALREQPVREVAVESERRGSDVVIRVSDTGVGAKRESWEEYFQPFVGESEPDPVLGEGTGLGLKIVRDFVAVYGGSARFIEPVGPWKTTVEITLAEE